MYPSKNIIFEIYLYADEGYAYSRFLHIHYVPIKSNEENFKCYFQMLISKGFPTEFQKCIFKPKKSANLLEIRSQIYFVQNLKMLAVK